MASTVEGQTLRTAQAASRDGEVGADTIGIESYNRIFKTSVGAGVCHVKVAGVVKSHARRTIQTGCESSEVCKVRGELLDRIVVWTRRKKIIVRIGIGVVCHIKITRTVAGQIKRTEE